MHSTSVREIPEIPFRDTYTNVQKTSSTGRYQDDAREQVDCQCALRLSIITRDEISGKVDRICQLRSPIYQQGVSGFNETTVQP